MMHLEEKTVSGVLIEESNKDISNKEDYFLSLRAQSHTDVTQYKAGKYQYSKHIQKQPSSRQLCLGR